MKPQPKLFSPRFSLLFLALPQGLLALLLHHIYQEAQLVPTTPLLIVFGIQAAFNLYIVADAVRKWKDPAFTKRACVIRLAGFIALMSAAMPFMLKQFTFSTPFEPEAMYAVLCLVPLLYTAAAMHHRSGSPVTRVGVRIAICIGFPLLVAVAVRWMARSGPHGISFNEPAGVADVLLILLFALFFAFIVLVAGIVYHFRAKKSAGAPKGNESPEADEKPIGNAEAGGLTLTVAGRKRSTGYQIMIALIALLLPLGCLFLNTRFTGAVLGDFSSPWFYVLAAVNGIAMLVPAKGKRTVMAALFFKSMGFLYVFYFVVVLMKLIPVVLATFYYLVPLLALTPAVLFIAEMFQIMDDFKFLKQHHKTRSTAAVFACGMAFLCAAFWGGCYVQKVNFDKALCYLYDQEQEYPPVNIPLLKTTLANVSPLRGRNVRDLFSEDWRGTPAPILTDIYHSIVAGGNTLSEDAYDNLTRIFWPEAARSRPRSVQAAPAAKETERVKITDIQTETSLDESTNTYKTWIHLQLENNTDRTNQEYAVIFALPDGVFVTDYYLDVNGERKPGIVSERSAAQRIYERIVSQSRDPGIIYYEQENWVTLKVFPFGAHERRNTGFMLMHKQSEAIQIAGHGIALEGGEPAAPIVAGDVCFMPASCKPGLRKKSQRTPRYYFIADISRPAPKDDGSREPEEVYSLIDAYAQSNGIAGADVFLTACDVQMADLSRMEAGYGEGGFNMALAMRKIYREAREHPDSYPVILVATADIYRSTVADHRNFIRDYPESAFYYWLQDEHTLVPYRFAGNAEGKPTGKPLPPQVLVYDGFFLKDDGQNEISYRRTAEFAEVPSDDDPYINALLLNGMIEKAATQAQIIETVKAGISQRVLTKNTAFIVLETGEQEELLRRRNQDFLEGKVMGALPARMSEPGLIAAILLAALLLAVLRLRRRDCVFPRG